MSEYQYYEFQAIDRPLTAEQMCELRSVSSRARITPTSFVNEYSWGGFKGKPDAWMEKYFDAFLYVANWGTRVFKLRLPARLLPLATVREYCGGSSFGAREKTGMVILSFESEDESGGDFVEGEGLLSSLITVRVELARGDLRALYLGWLLRAQVGEFENEEKEPPVPAGLGQLSASLERLASFLRIDDNLLQVAAQASPPLRERGLDPAAVRTWVTALPGGEKDEVIADLMAGGDQSVVVELVQRFLREQAGDDIPEMPRRTIGQLFEAADAREAERSRIASEQRAAEQARREREAAAARERRLDRLQGDESALWSDVARLIATKQPRNYDLAVQVLADLRDLALRRGGRDFQDRLAALRFEQTRKSTLIERLRKAGL